MKLFILVSILSLVVPGSAWGAGKGSCIVGESSNKSGKYQMCDVGGVWNTTCTFGTLSPDSKKLCIKSPQTIIKSFFKECKKDINLENIDTGEYECKGDGDAWKWVKKEPLKREDTDLSPEDTGKQKKEPEDTSKPTLEKLMGDNQDLFKPIVWGDKDPVEIARKLGTLANRFNCAFRLRNESKYGNWYSLFRGHGRKKSYEKINSLKKEGCPNGEVPFGDDWTPFDGTTRLKHFVWNLEFKMEKDEDGRDILHNDGEDVFTKWNLGWYQLNPVKKENPDLKPKVSEGLEWYDKSARAVEDKLEFGAGCTVGTNCRSFQVFKYKLANCKMREIYDSRCLAWAQSSKWVGSIIAATNPDKTTNEIWRENVVYAFIAEELLNRFDAYTYTNRKVRAVLSFIKKSKEFQDLEAMTQALSSKSESKLSGKDVQYIMNSLVPENTQQAVAK